MATAAGADNDAMAGRDAWTDGGAAAVWRDAGRTGTGGGTAGAACSTFGSGSTGKRCRLLHRWDAGGSGTWLGRQATVTPATVAIGTPAGAGVASTSAAAGANTIAILGSGDGAGNAMRCSRQTTPAASSHAPSTDTASATCRRRTMRSDADSARRAMPSLVVVPSGHRHTLVSAVRKAQAIRTAPATASARGAGAVWAVAAPTADRRDTHDRSRCGRAGRPARSRWRRNATR